jgi:hypothetical protein
MMTRMPTLGRYLRPLDRGGQVVRANGLATSAQIRYLRLTILTERETLTAALQHAQVVVVGMILHHQDDDVPDLRQQVRASRQGWPRERPESPAARAPGPASHLDLLESVPHDRATFGLDCGDIVSRGKRAWH